MDDLGKVILAVSFLVYLLGTFLQNTALALVGMIGLIVFAARALSGDRWERNEENRKYLAYLKLWKLRYENRKTARIYMCDRCGRYIRVPKGKGKIQITCPSCGNHMIRNT
jgi:DNA-directed RNA polymerase subunit RPC12/RpoP